MQAVQTVLQALPTRCTDELLSSSSVEAAAAASFASALAEIDALSAGFDAASAGGGDAASNAKAVPQRPVAAPWAGPAAARASYELIPAHTGESRVTVPEIVTSGTASKVVLSSSRSPERHGGGAAAGAGEGEVAHPKGIVMNGWMMFSTKSHIAADADAEKLNADVGFTLPEMVFDANGLFAYHRASGLCLRFCTPEALQAVRRVTPETSVKVPVADKWSKSRSIPEGEIEAAPSADRDWTFTTDYVGTCERYVEADVAASEGDAGASASATSASHAATPDSALAADAESTLRQTTMTLSSAPGDSVTSAETAVGIPYDKLKLPDPILWFDEVLLFEDELHDYGVAKFTIKVRVMPQRFFILARFWLRVDSVILRINDTRVFHEFGSDHIVREVTRRESSFERLGGMGKSVRPTDYVDANVVAPLLEEVHKSTECVELAPPA